MHDTKLVGARTHNLAGVSLTLRTGELTVLTGVSGSGKSSLAVDTLYAEGQRRYIESFSPYARQFLERLERPPCESLDPVPAGVAVDRRAPVKSSRSTVATMADLEAYLSALFTREAVPRCPKCDVDAVFTAPERAAGEVQRALGEGKLVVTYPARAGGTAEYLELRESLLRAGYRRLLVEGAVRDIDDVKPSEITQGRGEALVVVDRVDPKRSPGRLAAAIEEAFRHGGGVARAKLLDGDTETVVARGISCPSCARTFDPPRPSLFSYQSPVGACATCRGFGRVIGIDWNKVIPDPRLSLRAGALRCWTGSSSKYERNVLLKYCDKRGIPVDAPWGDLTPAQQADVLDGQGSWTAGKYPGVRAWFKWLEGRTYKMHVRVLLSRFRSYDTCTDCKGARLNADALAYRVAGLSLADWHALEVGQAAATLAGLTSATAQGKLVKDELASRLAFLAQVGLGYLSLDRQARTLSGGEAQRVSLTAALGSQLTGGLFVIDEPTVGLHATDVPPLNEAVRALAGRGNQVVVIEHDVRTIAAADRAIELGPGAGPAGGRVLFDGHPSDLAGRSDLPTGRALGRAAPTSRAPRKPRAHLTVRGAREHNLAGIDVRIPLGVLTVVTGPSGSGKSTLVRDIVHRGAARAKGDVTVDPPGAHDALEGLEHVTDVVFVDQAPLGRTSRGNAATYTKAWDRVRALYSAEPLAKARKIAPASFSFNVEGGRCDACAGEGAETVEMQFLADVVLTCPSCQGRRFQPHVLAILHRGLSVHDLLQKSCGEVLALFPDDHAVQRALRPVAMLGLGYLPLGQPLSTLSGGEAQRLKLARALSDHPPGTLFILDEPSAGLHAEDVAHVLAAMDALVETGCSVLVVDHDLDLVRAADWLIDLGPGAGREGGRLVDQGKPGDVRAFGKGRTAVALRSHVDAREPRTPRSLPSERGRTIRVEGAREHNLHDVSCDIPLGELVVVTGPSGSGKSTLAFDVVFAEGQRRFLETLTPYARQFLPMLPRADVDRVTSVPPSVALEQRTTRAGANSTVATVTEVAHHLRLLFAKVGEVHCPKCDAVVAPRSRDELFAELRAEKGTPTLLALAVRARKGTYLDVFTAAARAGFAAAICDGIRVSTDAPPRLAKTKEHTISIVVSEGASLAKLDRAAFDAALALGEGQLELVTKSSSRLLSTSRACPSCGTAAAELDPRWFSFNTKQGQCSACEGAGVDGGLAALAEGETEPCGSCGGSQLAPLPRGVRLGGKRYHEVAALSVSAARAFVKGLRFTGREAKLGDAALLELGKRLAFLDGVGLGYLTLARRAHTLSGGELQRLRLSAQLGSGLTGALYVLDEPTIGLHPRDTARLLHNLRALTDLGSTVLVVEHDEETIRAADHLLDLGPTGGRLGGRLLAAGTPERVLAGDSPTAVALRDRFSPPAPRPAASERVVLRGASANNLRGVTVEFPRARLVAVAGVSGSGKSTLVQKVLLPAVRKALGSKTEQPGAHEGLTGTGELRRALAVDQSPIGRTPRSVPATFLGVWDHVRKLYASSPDAQVAGFGPSRFSFNTGGGGRCPTCEGQGSLTHEMSFLPDVVTVCEACSGLRFDPRTLEVKHLGLSIGEVLRLSATEAVEHFRAHAKIKAPLAVLHDLGVGYLQLGQGSHTLSGGEAQRLKLAAELTAGARHEPTLYVLDEPTTGLHVADVDRLIGVLSRLVDRGDTLVVIEHHPRVLASADWLIELGPEGGDGGGTIVAAGTPREVARKKTATGKVLAKLFG